MYHSLNYSFTNILLLNEYKGLNRIYISAYLSCESGEMIVKINFSEPFRGVGYSDYDRTSPCKFYGDGGRYYEMRLPLKGCGTKQVILSNILS